MKEQIKKVLKASALGKKVYPCIQWVYRLVAIPLKRYRLRRYGVGMLERLHATLTQNNVDYYLDFGTLLGIVRENDFIRHDDDIDLTIVEKDANPRQILKVLLNNGFDFIHAMKVGGRIVEFSVAYKKLSADFFFYIPVNRPSCVGICGVYFDPTVKYDNPNQNNYRVWFFPDDIKTRISQFKGTSVKIPVDAEKLLEFEYGKGWRLPIKDWSADDLEERYKIMDDFAVRIIDINEVLGDQ